MLGTDQSVRMVSANIAQAASVAAAIATVLTRNEYDMHFPLASMSAQITTMGVMNMYITSAL